MSLAIDFLTDFLERTDQKQADFARTAGMTQPNLNDILKGHVEVSSRNLAKLLRGIRADYERDAFIAAYLRDQIPGDMADRVHVHLTRAKGEGMVMEEAEGADLLEANLAVAFAALPSDSYRKRVVRFLQQLRKDADLRDLFRRTMDYVDDGVLMQRDESRRTAQQIFEASKDAPTTGLPATPLPQVKNKT